MGQKVSPIGFRVGVIRGWDSKWFSKGKQYSEYLVQDIKIRDYVTKKLRSAAVAKVEFKRTPKTLDIAIYSSRPGIIIGRGGSGIEEIKKDIERKFAHGLKVNINIVEVKNPEGNAALVGHFIAEQLEKRISFRKVIKKALERTMGTSGVKGAKIEVAGRLDGADMSRREWLSNGKIPLHTIRGDIDFARVNAHTTYGVIGIKVWIYKGEVFDKKKVKKA